MILQPKKISENPVLQQEVADLEKRLIKKKQELTRKKEGDKHDKELIKEIIKEKLKKPSQPQPKVTLVTATQPTQRIIVKKAKQIKGQQKERQIKLLSDLAFEKGVIHATEVAEKLDDPYILDEFHDTLVDELYNYLIEQGKLKQV